MLLDSHHYLYNYIEYYIGFGLRVMVLLSYIQDIYFPLEKQKAKSRYVLKALVRQHDMDKPKWFIQNMTPVRFEKSTAIQ